MGFLKNSEVIEQNVSNRVKVYKEIAPAMEQYANRINLSRGLDINTDMDVFMKKLQDRTHIVSLLKTMTTEPNNVYSWLWQNDFIQVFLKYYNEFYNYILKRFLKPEEFKVQFRVYYNELLNKKNIDIKDMGYITNEADYIAYENYKKENPHSYSKYGIDKDVIVEKIVSLEKENELINSEIGNRKQKGRATPENINDMIEKKNENKRKIELLRNYIYENFEKSYIDKMIMKNSYNDYNKSSFENILNEKKNDELHDISLRLKHRNSIKITISISCFSFSFSIPIFAISLLLISLFLSLRSFLA